MDSIHDLIHRRVRWGFKRRHSGVVYGIKYGIIFTYLRVQRDDGKLCTIWHDRTWIAQ